MFRLLVLTFILYQIRLFIISIKMLKNKKTLRIYTNCGRDQTVFSDNCRTLL